MKKILIFIIGVLMMSGCVSVSYRYISAEPKLKSLYIGKDLGTIISLKGAPNREITDGVGGKIMVYEKYYSNSDTYAYGYGHTNGHTNGHASGYASGYANTLTQYKCNYIEFYIDSNNICYDVRTNIVNEEKVKVKKKIEWGALIMSSILISICLIPLFHR